jgi:hypothetical protein
MPEARAVFFAEPREFTQAQIDELREGGLLVEDEPEAPKTGGGAPVPGARAVNQPAPDKPADPGGKPEETP